MCYNWSAAFLSISLLFNNVTDKAGKSYAEPFLVYFFKVKEYQGTMFVEAILINMALALAGFLSVLT